MIPGAAGFKTVVEPAVKKIAGDNGRLFDHLQLKGLGVRVEPIVGLYRHPYLRLAEVPCAISLPLHALIDCILLEAIENAMIDSLERHWIAGHLLDNASIREARILN
jgi:hypothetical protein